MSDYVLQILNILREDTRYIISKIQPPRIIRRTRYLHKKIIMQLLFIAERKTR